MKMSFATFPADGPAERSRKFVDILEEEVRQSELAESIREAGRDRRPLHFLILDVTPARTEPWEIESQLNALLTSRTSPLRRHIDRLERTLEADIRLLFVGATPAIDTWEDESSRISTKKALEFYIRTLQSGRLAHYGSVVEPGLYDRVPTRGAIPEELCSRGLARSALIGLARYYGSPGAPKSFGELCDRLRRSISALLNSAKKSERHVLQAPSGGPTPNPWLLDDIAGLFQLGKRDSDRVYARLQSAGKLAGREGGRQTGAYKLRTDLARTLRDYGRARSKKNAVLLADITRELTRYEVLRDLGRCIGTDALDYLRRAAKRAEPNRGGILVIDDEIASGEDKAARLRSLLKLIGWDSACAATDARLFTLSRDSLDPTCRDEQLMQGFEVRHFGRGGRSVRTLESFSLILVEVEPKHRYVGPKLIQRLVAYLERVPARWRPPIIVLTRTESFGQIQQSLNLGATAYVLKERLYQLPFQMRRALEPIKPRPDTRHASSFRKLSSLTPEVRAELHRSDGLSFVFGGRIDATEGLVVDKREKSWIRELPKADLHCHFGTCIAYRMVHALALNSVRYMLPAATTSRESSGVAAVIRRATAAVAVAEWICARTGLHPMFALALGAGACAAPGKKLPDELPAFGLGNAIIDWLRQDSENVRPFEVASLLVAAIGRDASLDEPPWDPSRWPGGHEPADYFEHLDRVLSSSSSGLAAERRKWALERATDAVALQMREVAAGWTGTDTTDQVRAAVASLDGERGWRDFAAGLRTRVAQADARIKSQRRATAAWLAGHGTIRGLDRGAVLRALKPLPRKWHLADFVESGRSSALDGLGDGPATAEKAPQALPLERYVCIPAEGKSEQGAEGGLLRYLRGADLLGADHLQYPENILLAAFAFVFDCARDNVTYCEVRCETTGYCHGGMNPSGATDLLCRGLDLASLVISCASNGLLPLVRTNILIAAKRHKEEAAARDAVMLLTHYLHRRNSDEAMSPYRELLPAWWGPCRPVGFDVSGDESKTPEWLERIFDPLAKLSSPVTIHAGEAASALSIWTAVYRNHATRIGHGLRLREDDALLRYCVSEGICMEMCPNSNLFTNRFERLDGAKYPQADNPRGAYPLLEHMQKGLEVAISTDNRYLHPRGAQTLTSEYLAAARLSNGLTRWEILQLVKAGFKNAFLPKHEVQALLSAMEDRVYRIISRGWF